MSKKANPTIVGTFALVAITLAVIVTVILGNIKIKNSRFRCIAFFTGSLHGLDVGAPVAFRGVTIGRVSRIEISFDKKQSSYVIPVSIDLKQDPSGISGNNLVLPDADDAREMMDQMVKQGLRAQLKNSSLLTGKLYIDLAFYPDSEIHRFNTDEDLFEIPTLPSGLEQITQTLEKLPLDDILNKAVAALDGINSIISSEDTRHAIHTLDQTLAQLKTLLAHTDNQLPDVVTKLEEALAQLAALSSSARLLVKQIGNEVSPLSQQLQGTLDQLATTAQHVTTTLQEMDGMAGKGSPLPYQLNRTLKEIEQAASSLRGLTEYLQQNPNALIFGQEDERP